MTLVETDSNITPFLSYVFNVNESKIISEIFQSEEGGRFYKEQNKNMIIIDDNLDDKLPENYIWMSLNQLQKFVRFNNYLNIQLRSLISAIRFN